MAWNSRAVYGWRSLDGLKKLCFYSACGILAVHRYNQINPIFPLRTIFNCYLFTFAFRYNYMPSLVEQAARTAGADAFIRRLPQGYDTILTQGGAELSQGERQLLTIARAVLANAPILILDEATSSVDTVTEQNIRRAMLTVTEGRTSFIIAHRLSTIRDSDQIALIDGGRVQELGSHRELMALNGQYAALYRTQMGLDAPQ